MGYGSIARILTRAAIVAAVLPAAIFPAFAQQPSWRAASRAGDQQAFIDTTSIRRTGDRVRFLREIRMSGIRQFQGGERYDRIGAVIEVDCQARTLVTISLYAKLGDATIASGDGDDEIEPVRPGTNADTDLRAACFNQWPE